MSRETLQGLEERSRSLGQEDEALAVRLATLERAYEDLLARVRGYQRERREVRLRLERLIARLDSVSGPRG